MKGTCRYIFITWPLDTNAWPQDTSVCPGHTIMWSRDTNTWPQDTSVCPEHTIMWSRDTNTWPQDSNCRVPKLKGMLSSKGTIQIHNYCRFPKGQLSKRSKDS